MGRRADAVRPADGRGIAVASAGTLSVGGAVERRRSITTQFGRFGMLSVIAAAFLILLMTSPVFRSTNNLLNIAQQSSMIGIVAVGMSVVIISGGFDLSVGAVGALCAVVGASLAVSASTAVGVGVALGLGVAIGLLNGLLITKLDITPFIATLGMSSMVTGVMFVRTEAQPVTGLPAGITSFGLGRTLGIPNAALTFAFVALAVGAVMRFTRFGHYVYAVGSNPVASRLAGVPVRLVLVGAYAVAGMTAAVAGLVLMSQTGVAQPNAGTTWPLTAIAAVVVGGTPLRGGVGGVYSAVLGTLVLGVLGNALILYGVSPFYQPIITGVVVIGAVGVESLQRRNREGTE
jgi:ribose transport system permease protein